MSGLEWNKITAAILLSSLIAMLVGFVANILYKPELDVSQRGYQIELANSTSQSSEAKEEEEINITELIAKASADTGARIIKKCVSCHSFNEGGGNKIGPNLWAIIGASKGKKDGFSYSKAMLEYGGIWDVESLFAFLNKPRKYMPGTKMSFVGLSNPNDIADVIAYLKERAS